MATPTQETPKRFISGVACPACGHRDTTIVYMLNGLKTAECVECGHKMLESPSD